MNPDKTAQGFIDNLCERVPGIQAILVTDREGVVMMRAPADFDEDQRAEQMLTTIFSICSEQTSKVSRLGETDHFLVCYKGIVYLQANHLPLVITIIATPQANLGYLIELLPALRAATSALRKTAAQALIM
eukprot:GDKJ01000583.1.p1 GENE.GDKJ01000583.1~~GDKJ01000583.1.p1  ORF type:complete len:131 (+),score=23.08 GDKJ01000583.1:48-440(+)